MEGTRAARQNRRSYLTVLGLPILLVWQFWLTFGFFGADRAWERLQSDEPILFGQHALHQYHGWLGANAWRTWGSGSCLDPAFCAGYLKTPLFDAGSRPAELACLVGGGFSTSAYKHIIFLTLGLIPVIVVLAARSAGLGPGTALLAGWLTVFGFWQGPGCSVVKAGEIAGLITALALLAHAGFLISFTRRPTVIAWLGLLLSAALGEFMQPVMWFAAAPAFLLFYGLILGWHGFGWHLALWTAWIGAILANLGQLVDLGRFWWVAMPADGLEVGWQWGLPGSHHAGDGATRLIGQAILALAMIGLLLLWGRRWRRAAGCLWALLVLGPIALALFMPGQLPDGLALAILMAGVPAALGLVRLLRWVGRLRDCPIRGGTIGVMLLLLSGLVGRTECDQLVNRLQGAESLPIGWSAREQELITLIRTHTVADERILWEERARDVHWTPLLPLMTGRQFLGGLHAESNLPFCHARLCGDTETLAHQPITDYSDTELERFTQRYNIGVIACWTSSVKGRLAAWTKAVPVVELPEDGMLFRVRRSTAGLILRGTGRVVQADWRRIALADVVPHEGCVVLSVRRFPGWRVAPGYLQIERDPDPMDPVPFVRLRLPGPVARLTLYWEGD